jgi:predicted nucleic acid-binding protein
MSGYGSVLSVFWDADSLFRLASTKLPEERSATRTILRLTMLRLIESVTSEDALNDAADHLQAYYGASVVKMARWLRRQVRRYFRLVPTPLPDQVQVALSEVSDPADALILAACKGTNCLVLLTYNTRHFLQAKRVRVLTPRNFLERLQRALWEGFR